MQSLKAAVEEEDLGRVKSLLNTNPGLATEIYFQADGEPYTILKRAKEVAGYYTSPESFAQKIVVELEKRGAILPPEPANVQQVYNDLYGNYSYPAEESVVVAPPAPKPRRVGLPPLYRATQPHRNVSKGIAARRKSSRKRRNSARRTRRRN